MPVPDGADRDPMPARAVLERLLRRAEAAARRGAATPVSLPMSAASCPEYAALATLAEVEAFHAQVALAERDGAITVERLRHHGDGDRLRRLTVSDAGALARHLGVALLAVRVEAASSRLAASAARFPVLEKVLQAWRDGARVRGSGPDAIDDLVDAVRVVQWRQTDDDERLLRRESIRLFGDSKRIEQLTPWLEILVTAELAATALAREDVHAALGLRREPQPLLLAGNASVLVDGRELPLPFPYLGVPMAALTSVSTCARWLLTVENLASFHDAAALLRGGDGLLLYTGGMPSPTWRAAYARVLAGLPAGARVLHWGDIDEGGFRIAAAVAAVARGQGRELQPWLMSPNSLRDTELAAASVPTAAVLERMFAWAGRAGWPGVADALRRRPVQLEQEAVDPRGRLP